MREYLKEIINIQLCFQTYILMYLFQSRLFQPKYKRKTYYSAIVLSAFSAYIIQLKYGSILNFIYTIAVMLLCLIFLYKEKKKILLIYNIYIMLLLLVIDILISAIFSIYNKNLSSYIFDNEQYFLSSIVIMICNIIVYNIFIDKLIKYKLADVTLFETFFSLLVGTFLTVSIIITLSEESTERHRFLLIFWGFGSLILIFHQLYANKIFALYYDEIKKKEVQKNINILIEKYYAGLEEKNQFYRKMEHDISKHLNIIEKLVESQENKLVDEYINIIRENLKGHQNVYILKNKVLQAIINDTHYRAQLLNIEININIMNLSLDFLGVYDLTILFGNLIDNALEACSEIEENKRVITVRLYEFNDYIIFQIKNSCCKKICRDKLGNIISTKGKGKGIGLTNVKEVVEKYDGHINICDNISFFKVEIVFRKQ